MKLYILCDYCVVPIYIYICRFPTIITLIIMDMLAVSRLHMVYIYMFNGIYIKFIVLLSTPNPIYIVTYLYIAVIIYNIYMFLF